MSITASDLQIPDTQLEQWQNMVDAMATLADIPAGLIMRVDKDDIEVFVASSTEGNPYHPGDREHLANSGLYCETVLRTKEPLLIPDALADPHWKDNPDVKLNMISYLGFPILLPDQTPFGTLCILDSKANPYSDAIFNLLRSFRDLIQQHLSLLHINRALGDQNKDLSAYLEELQAFRGLIHICAKCKKIEAEDGSWQPVEKYLIKHPDADFSHGYCPHCYKEVIEEIENS